MCDADATCTGAQSVYFFSLEQKMFLSDGVAVHHLCVFGKLAPAYRNERINPYRLEAQTFEESESQDGIAAHDPRNKHLFVVDFENLDGEVC